MRTRPPAPRIPGLAAAVAVGRRVFLRRPTARDAVAFLAMVRASRHLHRPWVTPPADADAFAAYLRRARRPDVRAFLVCRRADGALAGVVNVSQIVLGGFRSAYLGYFASAPLAGQGYLAEGLALVVRHAFRTLGLHRLEANVQPGNTTSRALVRRLGFRLEGCSPRYLKIAGRWRDHDRWAITAEDGRARRRAARLTGGTDGQRGS